MLYFETKHPNETDYVSVEHFTDFSFGLHLHQQSEIMYVSEGELVARVEDRRCIISAGQLCLIMPMQAHSFETPVHSKCTVCVFSVSFAPDFYEKYKHKCAENPVIDFSSNKNLLEIIDDKKSDRYALSACFYMMISLLIKNSRFIYSNKKLHSFIEASLDYIDKNFDKDPKITELAHSLGYDAHYCSCLFNKTFGKNFPTMINEYRVALAQRMLAKENGSITDIACACGFSCIRSFNRNFLKITGVSPKALFPRP